MPRFLGTPWQNRTLTGRTLNIGTVLRPPPHKRHTESIMPVRKRSVSTSDLTRIITRRHRQRAMRILMRFRMGHYRTEAGLSGLQGDMAFLVDYDRRRKGSKAA